MPTGLPRGRVPDVRRKLAFLLGFAFVLALLRFLRRNRRTAALEEPGASGIGSWQAEELRRKLAESRAAEGPVSEAGPAVEPDGEATVEEERQRVHEQARSVLDEMRGSGSREP